MAIKIIIASADSEIPHKIFLKSCKVVIYLEFHFSNVKRIKMKTLDSLEKNIIF